MQPDAKKARQVRFYADAEIEKQLEKARELFPTLSEADVIKLILKPALQALEANGWRFEAPLCFVVQARPAAPPSRVIKP